MTAIFQDVQHQVATGSDIPLSDGTDWVAVALCGNAARSAAGLDQLQASVLPTSLVTPEVRADAAAGRFLTSLECADGWTRVPE